MSIPPLPAGAARSKLLKTANALHSLCIHLLRRAREADKQSGLSPERLSLLSILAYTGPQTINRLAEMEQVSPPAISRIVTALEKAKLALRKRNADDARVVVVSATPNGKRLVEEGRRRRLDIIAGELSVLPQKDLDMLRLVASVLEKLERPET
ncbi:MAG: MarR family winged helix-turn-helix transcriptional regulator [Pseudomonadota bacterium]